jgi:hypothetical protein
MSPEEKRLLERVAKLSEDNNEILHGLRRVHRWAVFWGLLKIAIFAVPFVIAYFYLEPRLGPLSETFKQAQEVLKGVQ